MLRSAPYSFVPLAAAPTSVPAPQADPEQEAWDLAKRRDTAQSYRAYPDAYPSGCFAAPARVAVQGLLPPPVAQASPAQPTRPTVIDGYEILDDPVLGQGSLAKDLKTGLVWQRCSVGRTWNGSTCTGQARQFTFDQAQALSRNGWRVPTVRELHSLVWCSSGQTKDRDDPKDGGPAIANHCVGQYQRPTIRTGAFPATPDTWYWTPSPNVGSSSYAWGVNFGDGYVYDGNRNYSNAVRLVRASQ